MVSFPPCKINLGLNIIGKRSDGYHDIATGFYPVQRTDVLDIVPAKDFSFAVSGDLIPGAAVDNLCVRAYHLLKKDFSLKPVAIHLLKCIPIGAGLGGGSADGAYTLRALNQIFDLAISREKMVVYAAQLGSDCAFFIENKPMIGTGRGEVLSALDVTLKGKYLVIVRPEVQILTATAYAGVVPHDPGADLRDVLERHPMSEWRHLLKNDFEATLFPQFPIIEALLQKLYALGAIYASMSGSGSAVFGIFENATNLEKEFESYDYWSGFLD